MQKTDRAGTRAGEHGTPRTENELTFSDLAPKPTEDRIDLDFSQNEKEHGK